MYKTIIFDLDGTLLDTTIGVIKAVRITIEELNLKMPSEEVLKTFVGPPMQSSFAKYFDMDAETALKSANLFRANYKKHSLFDAELYDGIIDLFETLKKNHFKIAVATNKSHENAMMILDKFGILNYCDYAMGSDLAGKLKKCDIIEQCIKNLKSKKEECVLIGDSDADAIGAEKAGVDFVAVTYGFGFKNESDISDFPHVKTCSDVISVKDYICKIGVKNV